VAVALAAVLASSGSAFAMDFGAQHTIDSGQAEEFVAVSAITPPLTQTTDPGDPANLPLVVDGFNATTSTTTVYRIQTTGVVETTAYNESGSFYAANNGDVTLTGGFTRTDTRTYDVADTWDVDANNTEVNGTFVANVTGIFTPSVDGSAPTFVESNGTITEGPETYLGGGNLTMDGKLTAMNGVDVTTRATATAPEGTGAGVLKVNESYAILGAKQQVGMSGMAALNGWTDPMAGLNGVYVTPTKTVIKGGTGTTTLTVDDDGAKFAGSTGQPVVVTGVADGSNPYDAVNMRTFDAGYSKLNRRISDVENKSYGGIAAAVALAGIPAPAAGKQYTVGAGWGNYEGENAFALGGRAQVTPEFQLTAGWGYSSEGNAFNVGAGYSW
jgi:hypothetical protein